MICSSIKIHQFIKNCSINCELRCFYCVLQVHSTNKTHSALFGLHAFFIQFHLKFHSMFRHDLWSCQINLNLLSFFISSLYSIFFYSVHSYKYCVVAMWCACACSSYSSIKKQHNTNSNTHQHKIKQVNEQLKKTLSSVDKLQLVCVLFLLLWCLMWLTVWDSSLISLFFRSTCLLAQFLVEI